MSNESKMVTAKPSVLNRLMDYLSKNLKFVYITVFFVILFLVYQLAVLYYGGTLKYGSWKINAWQLDTYDYAITFSYLDTAQIIDKFTNGWQEKRKLDNVFVPEFVTPTPSITPTPLIKRQSEEEAVEEFTPFEISEVEYPLFLGGKSYELTNIEGRINDISDDSRKVIFSTDRMNSPARLFIYDVSNKIPENWYEKEGYYLLGRFVNNDKKAVFLDKVRAVNGANLKVEIYDLENKKILEQFELTDFGVDQEYFGVSSISPNERFFVLPLGWEFVFAYHLLDLQEKTLHELGANLSNLEWNENRLDYLTQDFAQLTDNICPAGYEEDDFIGCSRFVSVKYDLVNKKRLD